MSGCSLTRVTNFCARPGWRNCVITLLVCRSMLTLVVFGREHILLGFDSLVSNGLDIPSGCFDRYPSSVLRDSLFAYRPR
jgi:hypothetical protein